MMHRGPDLVTNILFFSKALRKKNVGVTTDNVMDVLKGLSLIDIRRKGDFYCLLKSNFVSRREEMEPFDELFDKFWASEDKRDSTLKKAGRKRAATAEEREEALFLQHESGKLELIDWTEGSEEEEGLKETDLPAYSPDEILGRKDFNLLQKEELERVKAWVSALSWKLAIRLSRRWKKGKKGDRLDFRRSLRESMKYGGEMIQLRMKEPKPKPLRIVFFCDVSGSMDLYSQFLLLFMYGLQNHYRPCETFVFSTRLSPITSFLKGRVFEASLHLLSGKVLDWSGGTNIGWALHQFHQRHARLLHPNRTLFFIFSDGWDRGDTALLDSEMKNLKRQVKRVIWLNPLKGSRDYQPLCKGMSAALPYLDHFLPCHNFFSLKNLSTLVPKL